MEQKVIDFRLRPPYGDFQSGPLFDLALTTTPTWGDTVSNAILSKSMEATLKEMDDSNVRYGVVAAREFGGIRNQCVVDLVTEYPDRFIGLASIEGGPTPFHAGVDAAMDVVDRLILKGPLKGICLEPGITPDMEDMWLADDKRMYPFYEMCQKEGILVNFTWGLYGAKGQTRYMEAYRPDIMFRVIKDFPDMKIVLSHAGWPYIFETIAMALTEPNVYLNIDDAIIAFQPGYQQYVDAINNPNLRGKTLYASAYPIGPGLIKSVQRVSQLGVRPEYFPDFMYNTAAKLLGLD